MNDRDSVVAELQALRGEIRSDSEGSEKYAHSQSPRTEPGNRPEVERLLRELQLRLAAAAEDVDDAISAHPLAAAGAAFLLGIAVGRLIKRG